ncbi:MAG: hydroxyphenylacetyl-CoA thioesterase PaaI [Microbacteriaceae bacterium]
MTEKSVGARAMLSRDRAAAALGMTIRLVEPGRAVISMRIREDMLNGFDIVHGGIIFALADTAFAAACNEDERVTVAAGADITFLTSARLGQVLTATAHRRALSGRSGLYDVTVTDENDAPIAEFRGRSRVTTRAVSGAAASAADQAAQHTSKHATHE